MFKVLEVDGSLTPLTREIHGDEAVDMAERVLVELSPEDKEPRAFLGEKDSEGFFVVGCWGWDADGDECICVEKTHGCVFVSPKWRYTIYPQF
ncbi:MAG: hypothetical protein GX256_02470 [Fretibacterium sp.]|nr:hypothetical protein [Fretibacterium sp.]